MYFSSSDLLRIAMLAPCMAYHRASLHQRVAPMTCHDSHETLTGVHERQGDKSQGGRHDFHS